MHFSSIDLIASIAFTWVLGLGPAFIIRRLRKQPLSRTNATVIAFGWCFALAMVAMFLKVAAGEANPRFSPAWIFVFLISRWILSRDVRTLELSRGASASVAELSTDQIMARLHDMIADPTTSEEHRAKAKTQLLEYERRGSGVSRQPFQVRFPQSLYRRVPSRRALKLGASAFGLALIADLVLAISGYRLLVHERRINPGQAYLAGEWGDLGTYERPVVACWYWTGRNLLPEAFWYGVAESERDECPLLHKHEPGN